MFVALLALVGLLSIWFDKPANLTTAMGLVTAGLAFALQKVVTSIAGYFLILRGKTFTVGDRITMGGVRGDVVALGFFQTTILEMGQPPAVQGADPAMWVQSRQFTGRIVTIANSKLFDEPIYNYTGDFPFIWEEILPIGFRADFEPKVYWRLTDNWLELTVRIITRDHGIRVVKDTMSRDVLRALDAAGIGIASATYEIVGLPPLEIRGCTPSGASTHPSS